MAARERLNRYEKLVALSRHEGTATIEAAHAGRIAQKRRTAVEAVATAMDANRPPIRRKLNIASAAAVSSEPVELEVAPLVDPVNPAAAGAAGAAAGAGAGAGAEPTATVGKEDPPVAVRDALDGILHEIQRRSDAPKLYIITAFYEEASLAEPRPGKPHDRWVQALRVYLLR